jgi:hypothetical protein
VVPEDAGWSCHDLRRLDGHRVSWGTAAEGR